MVKKRSVVSCPLPVLSSFGFRLPMKLVQGANRIHLARPLQLPPDHQRETTDHGRLTTDEGQRSKDL
jgi:hypothetical protein